MSIYSNVPFYVILTSNMNNTQLCNNIFTSLSTYIYASTRHSILCYSYSMLAYISVGREGEQHNIVRN